jgi:hypothetical protein
VARREPFALDIQIHQARSAISEVEEIPHSSARAIVNKTRSRRKVESGQPGCCPGKESSLDSPADLINQLLLILELHRTVLLRE